MNNFQGNYSNLHYPSQSKITAGAYDTVAQIPDTNTKVIKDIKGRLPTKGLCYNIYI